MHDVTAARNECIAVCFQHFPDVEVLLDDGYLGLRRDFSPAAGHSTVRWTC
jgi:hypothetical protein